MVLDSLGSDERSTGQQLYIAILLLVGGVFLFGFYNMSESVKSLALAYLILLFFGLLAVAYDYIFRGKPKDGEVIDSTTVENKSILLGSNPRLRIAVIGAALAGGGLFALMIGGQSTSQLINSPTFGLLTPTPEVSGLLSGLAGLMEDLIFFAILPASLYGVLRRIFGAGDSSIKRLIALAIAIFLAATLFMAFHVGVYGGSPTTLDKVFMFGIMGAALTGLTGMVIIIDAFHFWNNFAVTYYTLTAGDITGYIIFYELIVIAGVYIALKRSG